MQSLISIRIELNIIYIFRRKRHLVDKKNYRILFIFISLLSFSINLYRCFAYIYLCSVKKMVYSKNIIVAHLFLCNA